VQTGGSQSVQSPTHLLHLRQSLQFGAEHSLHIELVHFLHLVHLLQSGNSHVSQREFVHVSQWSHLQWGAVHVVQLPSHWLHLTHSQFLFISLSHFPSSMHSTHFSQFLPEHFAQELMRAELHFVHLPSSQCLH